MMSPDCMCGSVLWDKDNSLMLYVIIFFFFFFAILLGHTRILSKYHWTAKTG